EEHPVPEPTRLQPLPEEALRPAELVRGGEVEGGAPGLQQRVERAELSLPPRPSRETIGENGAQARGARDDRRNHRCPGEVRARPPPCRERCPAGRGAPR